VPDSVAIAALWGAIHNLRFMINRGLISPNEVEEFAGSIFEGLQSGDENVAAHLEAQLTPMFAEMKEWAVKLWIGREESNPR